jgi:hypothetical protein
VNQPFTEDQPRVPPRLDLILLLALIAAVILGLCVVLGTGPGRV